jgi:hypothetical protein
MVNRVRTWPPYGRTPWCGGVGAAFVDVRDRQRDPPARPAILAARPSRLRELLGDYEPQPAISSRWRAATCRAGVRPALAAYRRVRCHPMNSTTRWAMSPPPGRLTPAGDDRRGNLRERLALGCFSPPSRRRAGSVADAPPGHADLRNPFYAAMPPARPANRELVWPSATAPRAFPTRHAPEELLACTVAMFIACPRTPGAAADRAYSARSSSWRAGLDCLQRRCLRSHPDVPAGMLGGGA